MVLLASGDGGRVWRTGTMPTGLQHAQGETTLNVAIGDAGDCYEGFHYGLGQDPASGDSYFGFVSLASDSAVLGYMPLTNDGNGMSARLVTELDGYYPGWAPVFGDLAGETTNNGQIVWHAVP